MKSVKECNLMVEVYFKAKSYNVIKIDSIGVYLPFRQKLYYLEKWVSKGWLEYGTSINNFWITYEGERELKGYAYKILANCILHREDNYNII